MPTLEGAVILHLMVCFQEFDNKDEGVIKA